ncbi:DUF3021 domain-containing protein [[Ruminococcus] torques]|uniref:DUF3021 domain-containing protein n=1 Tax=[Ruminococcus] torques TaxID=33039 RepID=UPI0025A48DB1|nr:DUF3021 domain-containing protein [[Ruminococcus] torques]MDM8236441.1 DUF3021 domain-containing protein [[Ruminococcus] torques]
MKKQILLRGMLGFPLGLAMGYLITIFISLTVSDGRYYPCVPELAAVMGNEINAVLLQAVLCGILGAGFGACSVIWQIENWGIVKQTGIYFSIISVIMLPIAYVSYWMEHSLKGILGYFSIFALIFAAVWIVQYTAAKHNVRKMNETLCRRRDAP